MKFFRLFSETRAQAANPLKASQAYKNIVDGLTEAKEAAEDANVIIDGARGQVIRFENLQIFKYILIDIFFFFLRFIPMVWVAIPYSTRLWTRQYNRMNN